MIVEDHVKIVKSYDTKYLNKKGKIIHYNPLTKKYTIFIPSIPIKRDKYVLKTEGDY